MSVQGAMDVTPDLHNDAPMSRSLTAIALLVLCSTAWAAPKVLPAIKRSTHSVTLVFDVGGLGDRGFLDAANDGLLRAAAELGVRGDVVESLDGSERAQAMDKLVQRKPDLAIAVGFLFSAQVNALAAAHPAQKFAVVDYVPTAGKAVPSNLQGIVFRDEQGAFLAGALAAMTSKTGKIGFVGGMDSPVVKTFLAGYSAGARHVSPSIQILVELAGTTPEAFANPPKGKALALKEYDAGADIIFHAAGATGLGVFDAARERKKLVIGVDTNQWEQAPGLVLTSVVKRVDVAVFDVIRSTQAGTFKGGVTEMGLHNQGISLVLDANNAALVDEAARTRLGALQADILAGKIKVPRQ